MFNNVLIPFINEIFYIANRMCYVYFLSINGYLRSISSGISDYTIIRYFSVRISISNLSSVSSPSAILRLIIPIVVNPVDSVMFAISIQICPVSELFKRISPLVTNTYSAASIAMIPWIVWIAASAFHSNPNIIQSCSALIMCSMAFYFITTTRKSTNSESAA